MTRTEALGKIETNGPRVLAEYGQRYFNGWRAGLMSATEPDIVPEVTFTVSLPEQRVNDAPVLPLGETA